jgi:hypothetical protein
LPEHVEEGGTGHEDDLDAHAFKVVELGLETLEIATGPKLGLPPVPLVGRLEEVVVGGVAVGELVHEDGIRGQRPPVLGRGGVGGVWTLAIILEGRLGILDDVEVVADEVVTIGRGGGARREEEQRGEEPWQFHGRSVRGEQMEKVLREACGGRQGGQ